MLYFKNYTKTILIIVSTILLLLIPAAYKALFIDQVFSHKNLWKYQMQRLSNSESIDTLFLGDSSLRHSIDSEYFNSISNLKSINLALTLSHGYAGSYNVLKQAVKKNKIKNVVIVNTIEILKWEISYEGYFHTSNSFEDMLELSSYERAKMLEVVFKIFTNKDNLKQIFNFYTNRDMSIDFFTEEDLLMQSGGKISINEYQNYPPWSERVLRRKTLFLEKIIDLCEKEEINLIYMHGPVAKTIIDNSDKYISNINQIIMDRGAFLISEVPEITYEKIGNQSNHISTNYRKEYTEKYYNLIEEKLIY
jgi:hypothetical protein